MFPATIEVTIPMPHVPLINDDIERFGIQDEGGDYPAIREISSASLARYVGNVLSAADAARTLFLSLYRVNQGLPKGELIEIPVNRTLRPAYLIEMEDTLIAQAVAVSHDLEAEEVGIVRSAGIYLQSVKLHLEALKQELFH